MATKCGSFYSALPGQVLVGIETTGSMHWFLKLMEDLEIDCQVGHPSKVRAAEPRNTSFGICSYKKAWGVGDCTYFSLAYSAFAAASSGRSGSASFHVARKS